MSTISERGLDPHTTSADLRKKLVKKFGAKKSQWGGLLFIAPALIMVLVFFITPLVMAGWMSLHNWPLLGTPTYIGLGNYKTLLNDAHFHRALIFTGKYAFWVTIAIFCVAFPLALFVDSSKRFVGFFRTSFFLPSIVGFATSCLLWVWLLNPDFGLFSVALQRLGLTSKPTQFLQTYDMAFISILAIVTWRGAGFTMLLLLTGIQSIPTDIQEAARIDGATGVQRFFLITLPLIRRTLLLSMILSITGSILAFDQFYIITMGGPRNRTMTAVYQIYRNSFISFKLGYGAALSIVLMLILIAFTLFQFFVLRERKDSKR